MLIAIEVKGLSLVSSSIVPQHIILDSLSLNLADHKLARLSNPGAPETVYPQLPSVRMKVTCYDAQPFI